MYHEFTNKKLCLLKLKFKHVKIGHFRPKFNVAQNPELPTRKSWLICTRRNHPLDEPTFELLQRLWPSTKAFVWLLEKKKQGRTWVSLVIMWLLLVLVENKSQKLP